MSHHLSPSLSHHTGAPACVFWRMCVYQYKLLLFSVAAVSQSESISFVVTGKLWVDLAKEPDSVWCHSVLCMCTWSVCQGSAVGAGSCALTHRVDTLLLDCIKDTHTHTLTHTHGPPQGGDCPTVSLLGSMFSYFRLRSQGILTFLSHCLLHCTFCES